MLATELKWGCIRSMLRPESRWWSDQPSYPHVDGYTLKAIRTLDAGQLVRALRYISVGLRGVRRGEPTFNELLLPSVETVVDRVRAEFDELYGRPKDIVSVVLLMFLANVPVVWVLVSLDWPPSETQDASSEAYG